MSEPSVVLTWRPGNKKGVYIQKKYYDLFSNFIISLLKEKDTLTLNDLIEYVQAQLILPDINLVWTLLQVKLDLEAKGLIKVSVVGPNRLQLIRIKKLTSRALNTSWLPDV